MRNQKRFGLLLSYINLALGMIMNFVLTPMLITAFSDETYSLYRVIQSMAGPLVVFNLGLAGVTTRCVAKYRSSENADPREKQNMLAMVLLIAAVMAVVIILIGMVMIHCVPYLYGKTYPEELLLLAKKLLTVFVISAAINVLSDIFRGCINGNERFVYKSAVGIIQTVFRFGMSVFCVRIGMGVLSIALAGLAGNLVVLLLMVLYSVGTMGERFRLYRWDHREFKIMLSFSAAILLQTLVNQVNNHMDVVILGAMVMEKKLITMYSSALTIYAVYNSLLSVVPELFLPQTIRMVHQNHSGEELTDLMIRAGRIQSTLSVGILIPFGLFGKEFITLWIGSSYENAYYVALLLMIPATVPLVQNSCLNILDAKLKRLFRSVVLVCMAGLNLIITVILVRDMGYWGAAIGTCISLIIGHGVIMNLYYRKALGLNVLRMFSEIFQGILPCGILAGAVCIVVAGEQTVSIGLLVWKCLLFCGCYGTLLWLFGWNAEERIQIRYFLRKQL